MTHPITHWCVTPDAANDEVYAILAQDPVWNCFALADLEPPLRDYSQFAIARRDGSDEHALCLIMRHPIIGQVLSPFGAEEGFAAILNQIMPPEHPLIQAQEKHVSLLRHYYAPETSWKKMLRMALTTTDWMPLQDVPQRAVKRLTVSDLAALKNLYAQHPESGFSADLFTQGVYVGAYEGEQIIAAGGTHALASESGIAELGNILTAPQARGQGFGTAITAALVTLLFEERFSTIVLNIYADNFPAIRVYQRLGFQTNYRLLTGKAMVHSEYAKPEA